MQPLELTVAKAAKEAPVTGATLMDIAERQRLNHTQVNSVQIIRHWDRASRSYCYQTHIAISEQSRDRLPWLLDVLYSANSSGNQPWYPQFLGGASLHCDTPSQPGIAEHQLSVGCFDLGLPTPRCYRQLVSRTPIDSDACAIVARSVDSGPPIPADARLAYTLGPNGEVLHWEGDCLHWHHICCTPGAALLPATLDRWLINAMRRLGLDRAERSTYRMEAEEMRNWLQSPGMKN